MKNTQVVAERIKIKSKQSGVTVKKLLEDCSLGVNTVTKMSAGNDILSQNLVKIADYLGCSVDYLLGRTDKPEGMTQINTGDVGNNSSVDISKTACNCDDELVSLINSLSLLERSKVVLFIDSLRQNENKG